MQFPIFDYDKKYMSKCSPNLVMKSSYFHFYYYFFKEFKANDAAYRAYRATKLDIPLSFRFSIKDCKN